jgi:hypothetical protein
LFVVVVALLFVLTLSVIAFTDVVDQGVGSSLAALTQMLRSLRSSGIR